MTVSVGGVDETLVDRHLAFAPGSGGLSQEECEIVRELAVRQADTESPALVGGGRLRPEVRRSRVSWLSYSDETSWLFSRVFSLAHAANVAARWDFDLDGPSQALQLTTYVDSELGAFDWHLDLGPGPGAFRKVSVSIEIDSAEEGGVLQFSPGPFPRSVRSENGTAIVFPSYLPHRLTPVTKGRRLSLVAWICGPRFR